MEHRNYTITANDNVQICKKFFTLAPNSENLRILVAINRVIDLELGGSFYNHSVRSFVQCILRTKNILVSLVIML